MALKMLLGRNICRYVSSRAPALSANSVASSSSRGGIPLGARRYSSGSFSGWKNSRSVCILSETLFWTISIYWGSQLLDWDCAYDLSEIKRIDQEIKDTSEIVEELRTAIEEQRLDHEALKMLLANVELARYKNSK